LVGYAVGEKYIAVGERVVRARNYEYGTVAG
jgi:hypothetical protein